MMPEKALYMIPVPISDGDIGNVLPPYNSLIIKEIKYFIVEKIRTARRFLKKIDKDIKIEEITFFELNGHTPKDEISGYLKPLRQGAAVGLMSEAGCPGVADPGASVVSIAQNEGLKVIPLVGPSSILLALMASGLNGQRFSFHGYLPVKDNEREKTVRELESQSRRYDMTQICIETPYRNSRMMQSLLKTLAGDTRICVASDITSPDQSIVTKTVREWKTDKGELSKVPTIFLFSASNEVR